MMKQSLEKQPTQRQTQAIKSDLARDLYPAACLFDSGKSKRFWRLNWLHLMGYINRLDGRIKTCLRDEGTNKIPVTIENIGNNSGQKEFRQKEDHCERYL